MWWFDLWVPGFWVQVVELKYLEIVEFCGLEPGVDGRGSALEVGRRDAEAVNGTFMAGEDGFWKVEIISDRFSTAVDIERSPLSSDVFVADDLLGWENGEDLAMDCF